MKYNYYETDTWSNKNVEINNYYVIIIKYVCVQVEEDLRSLRSAIRVKPPPQSNTWDFTFLWH